MHYKEIFANTLQNKEAFGAAFHPDNIKPEYPTIKVDCTILLRFVIGDRRFSDLSCLQCKICFYLHTIMDFLNMVWRKARKEH